MTQIADALSLPDDQTHCELTNQIIRMLNEVQKCGFTTDFVASAVVAACAAYSVFNIQSQGGLLDDHIDHIAEGFVSRMREFAAEMAECK